LRRKNTPASPEALRQRTPQKPTSIRVVPVAWHSIAGQCWLPARRKPQKSAIPAPRPTPKPFKFGQSWARSAPPAVGHIRHAPASAASHATSPSSRSADRLPALAPFRHPRPTPCRRRESPSADFVNGQGFGADG
jgi:hypothetical protein